MMPHCNPETKENEVVISFVDGVVGLYAMAGEKCNTNDAAKKLRRLRGSKDPVGTSCPHWIEVKFPSARQRETSAEIFPKMQ